MLLHCCGHLILSVLGTRILGITVNNPMKILIGYFGPIPKNTIGLLLEQNNNTMAKIREGLNQKREKKKKEKCLKIDLSPGSNSPCG